MSRTARPAGEPPALEREQLSAATFGTLRDLLHAHSGIALAAHKLTMVQSRLAKRLRALGIQTYEEYLRQIEDPQSAEWPEFINALTTNLTSFFREGHHFTRLVELLKPASPRRIRIWSAGCSTGEEAYSIAILLQEPPVPTMLRQKLCTRLSYGGHGRNWNDEGCQFRKWRGPADPPKAAAFHGRVQAEDPGRG